MRWMGHADTSLIVPEATGAYRRQFEARFAAADLPYAKVNPRQSRLVEVASQPAGADRISPIMPTILGTMLRLQRQKTPTDEIVDLR